MTRDRCKNLNMEPLITVVLLVLNICMFGFLWWKMYEMEKTIRRIIGLLVANGWSLTDPKKASKPGDQIKIPKTKH